MATPIENASNSVSPQGSARARRAQMKAMVRDIQSQVAAGKVDENLREQLRAQLEAEWRPVSAAERAMLDQFVETSLRLRLFPAIHDETMRLVSEGITVSADGEDLLMKLNAVLHCEHLLTVQWNRLVRELGQRRRDRAKRDREAKATPAVRRVIPQINQELKEMVVLDVTGWPARPTTPMKRAQGRAREESPSSAPANDSVGDSDEE